MGDSSNRAPEPKATTLRELYLASGGVCAIPGCYKRLNTPGGAWIGTVAHIVAASPDGPRADSSMSDEQKRSAANLMLVCADHGREIDDAQTGEARYPRHELESAKRAHELRFAQLIDQMLEVAAVPTASDFLDVGARPATRAGDAAAFVQYFEIEEDGMSAVRTELENCRKALVPLSEPALGTLALFLQLWTDGLGQSGGHTDFRIGWLDRIEVHESLYRNRERDVDRARTAVAELVNRGLVSWPEDDVYDEHRTFDLRCPWSSELTRWDFLGEFLEQRCGISLYDWVRELDFGCFDSSNDVP